MFSPINLFCSCTEHASALEVALSTTPKQGCFSACFTFQSSLFFGKRLISCPVIWHSSLVLSAEGNPALEHAQIEGVA